MKVRAKVFGSMTAFLAFAAVSGTGLAATSSEELGGLVWENWTKTEAGGSGLPAGVQNKDYLRCKACHGWDWRGTDGGYARRTRKDSRPNGGAGDGDDTSRNISGLTGSVTADMVLKEGTGRSYADGTGSWTELSDPSTAENTAAHAFGYTLGNQHPDLSTTGVNGADIVLTTEQVQGVVDFLNCADCSADAYFAEINTIQTPALYTMIPSADSAAGEAYYTASCVACHGAPDDDQSTTVAGTPEGGLLAYLAKDGKFSEFSHKVRWGSADTIMTRASVGSPTSQQVADLMLYLQELGGTGFQMTGGIAGWWWAGTTRNGEGAVLDVIVDDDTGEITLVVSFYTYDNMGQQVFLVGPGAISGNSSTVDLVITEGGDFGSAHDPANVVETPFGTAEFAASGCEDIHVIITPNADMLAAGRGFEVFEMDMTRLATEANWCP